MSHWYCGYTCLISEDMAVPERLRGILDILTQFREKIVIDTTESNTAPSVINDIRKQLFIYGIILVQYIESDGKYIHPNADHPLVNLIERVTPFLYPSNAEISSTAVYWIEQLFQESPFTLSSDHIERMKKSIDMIDE
jgi:hypothetical protein